MWFTITKRTIKIFFYIFIIFCKRFIIYCIKLIGSRGIVDKINEEIKPMNINFLLSFNITFIILFDFNILSLIIITFVWLINNN